MLDWLLTFMLSLCAILSAVIFAITGDWPWILLALFFAILSAGSVPISWLK